MGVCKKGAWEVSQGFAVHFTWQVQHFVNVALRDAWHRHNVAHFSWYGQHSFTTESRREVVERKRGKCWKRECCREVLQKRGL